MTRRRHPLVHQRRTLEDILYYRIPKPQPFKYSDILARKVPQRPSCYQLPRSGIKISLQPPRCSLSTPQTLTETLSRRITENKKIYKHCPSSHRRNMSDLKISSVFHISEKKFENQDTDQYSTRSTSTRQCLKSGVYNGNRESSVRNQNDSALKGGRQINSRLAGTVSPVSVKQEPEESPCEPRLNVPFCVNANDGKRLHAGCLSQKDAILKDCFREYKDMRLMINRKEKAKLGVKNKDDMIKVLKSAMKTITEKRNNSEEQIEKHEKEIVNPNKPLLGESNCGIKDERPLFAVVGPNIRGSKRMQPHHLSSQSTQIDNAGSETDSCSLNSSTVPYCQSFNPQFTKKFDKPLSRDAPPETIWHSPDKANTACRNAVPTCSYNVADSEYKDNNLKTNLQNNSLTSTETGAKVYNPPSFTTLENNDAQLASNTLCPPSHKRQKLVNIAPKPIVSSADNVHYGLPAMTSPSFSLNGRVPRPNSNIEIPVSNGINRGQKIPHLTSTQQPSQANMVCCLVQTSSGYNLYPLMLNENPSNPECDSTSSSDQKTAVGILEEECTESTDNQDYSVFNLKNPNVQQNNHVIPLKMPVRSYHDVTSSDKMSPVPHLTNDQAVVNFAKDDPNKTQVDEILPNDDPHYQTISRNMTEAYIVPLQAMVGNISVTDNINQTAAMSEKESYKLSGISKQQTGRDVIDDSHKQPELVTWKKNIPHVEMSTIWNDVHAEKIAQLKERLRQQENALKELSRNNGLP